MFNHLSVCTTVHFHSGPQFSGTLKVVGSKLFNKSLICKPLLSNGADPQVELFALKSPTTKVVSVGVELRFSIVSVFMHVLLGWYTLVMEAEWSAEYYSSLCFGKALQLSTFTQYDFTE